MGSPEPLLWKRCIYSATVSTLKIPIGIQNKVTFTGLIVLHSIVSRKQPPVSNCNCFPFFVFVFSLLISYFFYFGFGDLHFLRENQGCGGKRDLSSLDKFRDDVEQGSFFFFFKDGLYRSDFFSSENSYRSV